MLPDVFGAFVEPPTCGVIEGPELAVLVEELDVERTCDGFVDEDI